MKHRNRVEFEVSGRYALFTDPITKAGGERFTLPVPTYEAIKGILRSVYFDRSFEWVVDSVRVMNPIRTESMSVVRRKYRADGSELSVYTYLRDVRYKVQAHFEESGTVELDEDKHFSIAKRMLRKGGRYEAFLGTKDCLADIKESTFCDDSGYYDNSGTEDFGLMYHGMTYPTDINGKEGELYSRLWHCVMENGIIRFPKPQDCIFTRYVRSCTTSEKRYELV